MSEKCFIYIKRCASTCTKLFKVLGQSCHFNINIERADVFLANYRVNLLVCLARLGSKAYQTDRSYTTYTNTVFGQSLIRLCCYAFIRQKTFGRCGVDTSMHIGNCYERNATAIIPRISSWRCFSTNYFCCNIINRYLFPRIRLRKAERLKVNKEGLVNCKCSCF